MLAGSENNKGLIGVKAKRAWLIKGLYHRDYEDTSHLGIAPVSCGILISCLRTRELIYKLDATNNMPSGVGRLTIPCGRERGSTFQELQSAAI